MNVQAEKFYLNQNEGTKASLFAMREMILSSDINVSETAKYGMPCFTYKKKVFCYLWVDKKTDEPYILFVEGNRLNHPRLEVGSRSRMKILRINPAIDIPIRLVKSLLKAALDFYRKGIIKT